jgi:hypothetical protein
MKLRTKIADMLSSAWERAAAPNNIYSRVYKRHEHTPVNDYDFFKAGTTKEGETLYEKRQLHLPHDSRVWAVATPAKGEKDKYIVTSYYQNLNTGTYDYSMNEKSHSQPISYNNGRSLFTRNEAIDVLRALEKQYQEKGYYQASKQPPAGKLAANLPVSGPTPPA